MSLVLVAKMNNKDITLLSSLLAKLPLSETWTQVQRACKKQAGTIVILVGQCADI